MGSGKWRGDTIFDAVISTSEVIGNSCRYAEGALSDACQVNHSQLVRLGMHGSILQGMNRRARPAILRLIWQQWAVALTSASQANCPQRQYYRSARDTGLTVARRTTVLDARQETILHRSTTTRRPGYYRRSHLPAITSRPSQSKTILACPLRSRYVALWP